MSRGNGKSACGWVGSGVYREGANGVVLVEPTLHFIHTHSNYWGIEGDFGSKGHDTDSGMRLRERRSRNTSQKSPRRCQEERDSVVLRKSPFLNFFNLRVRLEWSDGTHLMGPRASQ
jgi:hypothetical protein